MKPVFRRAAPERTVVTVLRSWLDRSTIRGTGMRRLKPDEAEFLTFLLSAVHGLIDPHLTPEGQPSGDWHGDDVLQKVVAYDAETGRGDCMFCIGHQSKPPGARMWRPLEHAPNCPWVTLLKQWGAIP